MDDMMLMKLLVPESWRLLQSRYQILRAVLYAQPIGRRMLARQLEMSERVLRSETDLLKNQNLILYSSQGMLVTEKGEQVFKMLQRMIGDFIEMSDIEQAIAKKVGIRFCKVISSTSSLSLSATLSDEVQRLLDFLLPLGETIVAVTGGQTMALLADHFSPMIASDRQLAFVPARGGVGGSTLIQANSVSEQMAVRTGGKHYSLYIPEHLSQKTYVPLMEEPLVAKTIAMMKQAQCVLYSVGSATIMAERRGLTQEDIQILTEKRAIGEAFGYFFDVDGKIVFKLPRIGLHLDDLETIPYNIAIMEGSQKAEAFKAYAKLAPIDRTWFVIDESLATMVLNGETR